MRREVDTSVMEKPPAMKSKLHKSDWHMMLASAFW